jgi:hypothetical protein
MLKLIVTKIYIVFIFLLVTPSAYSNEKIFSSCPEMKEISDSFYQYCEILKTANKSIEKKAIKKKPVVKKKKVVPIVTPSVYSDYILFSSCPEMKEISDSLSQYCKIPKQANKSIEKKAIKKKPVVKKKKVIPKKTEPVTQPPKNDFSTCPYNNFDKYIHNDIKSYHWHKCSYHNDSVELMLYKDNNLLFYIYQEYNYYKDYLEQTPTNLVINIAHLVNVTGQSNGLFDTYALFITDYDILENIQAEDSEYANVRKKIFRRINNLIHRLIATEDTQLSAIELYYKYYLKSIRQQNNYFLYFLLDNNYNNNTMAKFKYDGKQVTIYLTDEESPFSQQM